MKIIILIFALLVSMMISGQNYEKNKRIPSDIERQIYKNSKEYYLFWESFDNGLMPPADWTLNSLNTSTWRIGDINICNPYYGDYFAICRYDETLSLQDEKLITKPIDFSGISDAKLSFVFIFSKFWGIYPNNNYDLQVLVSTDGGITFPDTVWTELLTDTSALLSYHWTYAEVNMTGYVDSADVRLCFRYYGRNGNGADAAIDAIAITFTTSTGEYITMPIQLFPNPAKDYINLHLNEKSDLYIYNNNGQLLKQQVLFEGNNSIDLSELSPGLYSFVILSSKGKTIKKIVVH